MNTVTLAELINDINSSDHAQVSMFIHNGGSVTHKPYSVDNMKADPKLKQLTIAFFGEGYTIDDRCQIMKEGNLDDENRVSYRINSPKGISLISMYLYNS